MNFLGNLQVFFCIFLCSIDVLDPENQPWSGSRALGLTEDVWHQKYENKKEGFQNYLEYLLNSISNIFYRSGYRALDPEIGKNRIHITCHGHLTLVGNNYEGFY